VPKADGTREYKGLIDCVKKICRTEGVGGLYKGGLFSTFTIMPYLGISFASYDTIKGALKSSGLPGMSGALGGILGGATAGVFAQTLTYPLDTLRRRIQLDGMSGAPKKFKSILHAFKFILANEGVGSFYGGVAMNAIKAAPGGGLQFAAYDFFKFRWAQFRAPKPCAKAPEAPKPASAAEMVTKAPISDQDKAKINSLYNSADLNKDNSIGKGELVILLSNYGYTWHEVDLLFNKYDKNKSGDIEWDEFKELILDHDTKVQIIDYPEHQ